MFLYLTAYKSLMSLSSATEYLHLIGDLESHQFLICEEEKKPIGHMNGERNRPGPVLL